jgi:FlaA1/EpsC-like NDP-sugar epimerase
VIESAGYTVRDADTPDGDIEIEIIGLRPGEKIEEELTLNSERIGTRYPKIFCAREGVLSEIEVAAVIRGLRQALVDGDDDAARAVISRWVEGYHAGEAGRKSS